MRKRADVTHSGGAARSAAGSAVVGAAGSAVVAGAPRRLHQAPQSFRSASALLVCSQLNWLRPKWPWRAVSK